MKATKTIPKEILDNAEDSAFKNDFFNRFKLRPADNPIALEKGISKNYLFPTFYGDVTCAISIFHCSYDKAQKLVQENLSSKVKPVKMTRGRSLIAFSSYQYKNVMGVAPYNEIAMAIPVMVNSKFAPPLLPMIMDSFSHFGYYIAGMPVTSYENQLRGNNIWGLPKVTQEISVKEENDLCITIAKEDDGNPYLTLKVPMTGSNAEFDVTSNLYSRLNGKLLQSETNFKANFAVNKYMDQIFKKGAKPDEEYITIGDSSSGKMLKDLDIEEHPFQFRYAEGMSSCFDLPTKEVQSWFKKIQ